MNVSAPFIRRPIGTTLLAIGIFLVGAVAYGKLPVASLPSIDFPAVFISTQYPGASPETMAATVAAPIERHVGEIAGLSELTSVNSLGNSIIICLFDLNRNVDGAARDVQAALNAAATDLPAGLPNVPIYRKANPNNAPVMIIALSSKNMSTSAVYDAADSVMLQRLSQVSGVSEVSVAGADQPAIRVTADSAKLSAMGLSMDDIRTTIINANAMSPVGSVDGPVYGRSLQTNDQLRTPADYKGLVVKNADGVSVLLSNVADVKEATRNDRSEATFNGVPAVLLYVRKQANANAIEVADQIKDLIPQVKRFMPAGVEIAVLSDRTTSIRASVDDMTYTLIATIILVMMVVFVFLRRITPTLAAGVTVPLALAGTCACMYVSGFSIDNISLMALATSVGFVVDDAIVMIETIDKNRDAGMGAYQAALLGSRQIGFTVISISVSLMAAFIPLLLLGGIPGMLFHEFSLTLAFAILISTVASLTITPMICANFPGKRERRRNVLDLVVEKALLGITRTYAATLRVVLRRRFITLLVMFGTIAATIFLFVVTPKAFFPQGDSDLIVATSEGSPSISYQAMVPLQEHLAAIVRADPAVENVGSSLGNPGGGPNSSSTNQGKLFISLKPLSERGVTAQQIIDRLRPKVRKIVGIDTFMLAWQDVRFGGRDNKGAYSFTLTDNDYAELMRYYPKVVERFKALPQLTDVTTDHESNGLQANVLVDRTTASRLGVTMANIDNALDNSFAQRQISTIYSPRNQYRIILESPTRELRQVSDLTGVFVPAGVALSASTNLGSGDDVETSLGSTSNSAQPLASTTAAGTQTGQASGTQATNATLGTVGLPTGGAISSTIPAMATGQVRLQMRWHASRRWLCAANRKPSGAVPRSDDHLQHQVGRDPTRRLPTTRSSKPIADMRLPDTRYVANSPATSKLLAQELGRPASAPLCGAHFRLHRAWYPLRELRPSSHHHIDACLRPDLGALLALQVTGTELSA